MLGLQSSKSLKHAKKQQNLDFLRIFAEFSRKFARKVHEEPHRLGLRFFFYTIAKVFRRFQVARDSFSLLKPRKLRSRFSKFRIFALIVLLRLEANFEFQKCAGTSPNFRPYRVWPYNVKRGPKCQKSQEENEYFSCIFSDFGWILRRSECEIWYVISQ